MSKPSPQHSESRRRFLGGVGGATAATFAAGSAAFPLSVFGAQGAPPDAATRRANKAYQFRQQAAHGQKNLPMPAHPTNGDEELYASYVGCYSKALPHNHLGEVEPAAYRALLHAMATGTQADFEDIPRGGPVKQTNPQSALAFELDGADSHHLSTPPPPAFASEEQAGEMCEVYWLALTRDVPFSQYNSDPLIAVAVEDLRRFRNFADVNAGNIFRGDTPGDLVGPYVSQFLLKPYNFGAQPVNQQFRTAVAGNDFMTQYGDWLRIQNGAPPSAGQGLDPALRYIRNGRDLGEWVHRDFTYQGFLVAALILLGLGPAVLDEANPYRTSSNQSAFCTFGGPYVLDLVARAANLALKACWYQKWSVHRRVRPEAFGGCVHNHLAGAASYPIHPKLLNSRAIAETAARFGSHLLPMAYPEGSPTHPAYPSGHASIAGACTTVLKAFFKESFALPAPVQSSDDGFALVPYPGKLKVGDELDKLAANVALGRDTAGVHWRTDGTEGILLGEKVAVELLRDYRQSYNESFAGFSLTKFDGQTITI